MKLKVTLLALSCLLCSGSASAAEPVVMDLWTGKIPGPAAITDGPERDLTKPNDKLIAGRRIIKLGNVSTPQVHVYRPKAGNSNGSAVVICPGGGFNILAWDLEGSEVADWLNQLGFTAILLKYRVPTRQHDDPGKWVGPVMDAQRAISITRARAADWSLDSARVGILGFSAGGQAAAMTAVKKGHRLYEPTDEADQASCAVDFAMLIYPAGIADKDGKLKADFAVDKESPPMFFVHAADDRVTCLSSVALFTALKQADVPSEMHIYASGGHGYGLRPTEFPVTRWPQRAEAWLREMKLLQVKESASGDGSLGR